MQKRVLILFNHFPPMRRGYAEKLVQFSTKQQFVRLKPMCVSVLGQPSQQFDSPQIARFLAPGKLTLHICIHRLRLEHLLRSTPGHGFTLFYNLCEDYRQERFKEPRILNRIFLFILFAYIYFSPVRSRSSKRLHRIVGPQRLAAAVAMSSRSVSISECPQRKSRFMFPRRPFQTRRAYLK